ncbi:MAG: hypothetical protein KUG61_04380 [Parvibaculaceae bacterium]|nr:hypothetical protein [Parvibaculaceae bacterium]
MTNSKGSQDTNLAIQQVLAKFETGDASMFSHLADNIDFRIDHFQDDTDVSWQVANGTQQMMELMQRLASDVFPKGTKILSKESTDLGNGWYNTRLNQRFFYAVRQNEVESITYILTHEANGKLDYFRETVTTVDDI